MKLKPLFGVILAVSLLPAAMANAADIKIGFVDLNIAIENTKEFQVGSNRIKALITNKQKELDALRVQIEQAEKNMLSQTMAMSPERLSQKQSEIKELRKLYTRKQQDAQEEINGEQNRLRSAQGLKLAKVLKEFGKKGGYDLILPKAQIVLYSNPAHDVTSEITKLLDK
ncbi:MAG: OmpH family outer membrane protein [Mariprofundaceae bacterium]|nr:OmpH family outer membrane protein [Mariprofundaceae bacterium]